MSSQPPRPRPPSSSSYPAPTTASTDATTHTNVASRPTKKRVIRSSRFQSQVNAPASSSAQAPPLMPTSASGSGTYESAFSYRTRRRDASAAAAAAPSTGRGSGGERSATPSSSAAAGPSTRSLKKRRVAPPATTAAKTDAKDKGKGKGRVAAVVVDDDAMETSVPGKIRRRIPTPPKDEYDEPGREDERLAEFSCPICYSPPVNPCVISCGHLLCYTCLRDSLLSTQIRLGNPPPAFQAVGEPFNIDGACPICRLEIRGGLTGRSSAGKGDDARGRRRKKRKVTKTGAEQRDVDGVRVLELRVVDC